MATLIRFLNLKNNIKKFGEVSIIQTKNLHINVVPLTTNSSVAEKIFNEQLKNIHKCEDDESKFNVAHNIIKKVLSDKRICLGSSIVSDRNEEIIEYNLTGGKYKRMKLFLNVCQNFTPKSKLTDEFILRSWILGYLPLMLTSSLIIIDDILDKSETRRMKPTWCRKTGVEEASGHALMMSSAMQIILRTFFLNEPYYMPCLEVFNESFWAGENVFALECKAVDVLGKNKKYCTWETYDVLCAGLMASNAFKMPILAAMNMAGVKYDHVAEDLEKIFSAFGIISLVQNDYNDIFDKTSGKVLYEDIKYGKMSWFVLTALEHCNSDQKEILHDCYGKNDPDRIKAVVEVYQQLDLKGKYFKYMETMSRDISNFINKIEDVSMRKPLSDMLYQAENWYSDIYVK
ncbi:farnesyl pyrophosphate synthase-like [Planococcus citri]|uniref:farnesyl pyrophosphate synthase-like n=1 Tax=Planococcus citri TaxID=170843 RepID=UPI0031F79AD1